MVWLPPKTLSLQTITPRTARYEGGIAIARGPLEPRKTLSTGGLQIAKTPRGRASGDCGLLTSGTPRRPPQGEALRKRPLRGNRPNPQAAGRAPPRGDPDVRRVHWPGGRPLAIWNPPVGEGFSQPALGHFQARCRARRARQTAAAATSSIKHLAARMPPAKRSSLRKPLEENKLARRGGEQAWGAGVAGPPASAEGETVEPTKPTF